MGEKIFEMEGSIKVKTLIIFIRGEDYTGLKMLEWYENIVRDGVHSVRHYKTADTYSTLPRSTY